MVMREEAAPGVGVVAVGHAVRHGKQPWIYDLRGGCLWMEAVAPFAERVANASSRAVELEEEAPQTVCAQKCCRNFPAPVEAEEVVVKPVGEVYAGQVVCAFADGEPLAKARAVEVEEGGAGEASIGLDKLDVLVAEVAVCAAGVVQAADAVRDEFKKGLELGAVRALPPDFGEPVLEADGVREVERDEATVAKPRAIPLFKAGHRLHGAYAVTPHVIRREERAERLGAVQTVPEVLEGGLVPESFDDKVERASVGGDGQPRGNMAARLQDMRVRSREKRRQISEHLP